jgi:hypothetical protein
LPLSLRAARRFSSSVSCKDCCLSSLGLKRARFELVSESEPSVWRRLRVGGIAAAGSSIVSAASGTITAEARNLNDCN